MILVVDDDEFFLALVDRQFDRATVPAHTIRQGMEIARTFTPSAILLDVSFPSTRHDGIAAIAEFRALCPSAPIIIVTGDYDRDDALLAFEQGAYGYVEKGDLEQIARTVHDAIDPH